MKRGVHDLGGLPAGPIDMAEHDPTLFDYRVNGMLLLLFNPVHGHFTVDAMRRAIESLSPEQYAELGYYEKWLHALRVLTLEAGLITEDELAQKLSDLEALEGGR